MSFFQRAGRICTAPCITNIYKLLETDVTKQPQVMRLYLSEVEFTACNKHFISSSLNIAGSYKLNMSVLETPSNRVLTTDY